MCLGRLYTIELLEGAIDGIGEKFINLNQGAKSTISYLLARLSFKN